MCVPYTFNLHRINRVSGRARNANTRYVYTLGPSLRFRSTIWEEQREKERRRDARAFACCHRIVTPVIYDSINKSATFYPFSFSLSFISTSFNPWRRFLRTLVRWFWGLRPVYHPWIFLGWNQPFFFSCISRVVPVKILWKEYSRSIVDLLRVKVDSIEQELYFTYNWNLKFNGLIVIFLQRSLLDK